MDEILKQAKLKALRLLTDMDRTEEQLRTKLKQKGYPDEIVEQAIDYVKSFGYINDSNYARRFVESRKSSKSRKEIYAALIQKGLCKEYVEEALSSCYGCDDELQTIQGLVVKKHFSPEHSSEEEKKKLIAYLVRKGFSYESVRKVLEVSCWNA